MHMTHEDKTKLLSEGERHGVDTLLREMEAEGDGWHGRASGAIRMLIGKIDDADSWLM